MEYRWHFRLYAVGVFRSLSQHSRSLSLVSDLRLFNMIHVVGEPVTGTACSASNTWPLATTWLQRSAFHVNDLLIHKMTKTFAFLWFIAYVSWIPSGESRVRGRVPGVALLGKGGSLGAFSVPKQAQCLLHFSHFLNRVWRLLSSKRQFVTPVLKAI